ncbi:hypothetical protein OIO90_001486 [Microbotryomycetes sp. JL221]|nr:hypothetical protein OIO90_001486 [Microbotryomycetes sp. JL221]
MDSDAPSTLTAVPIVSHNKVEPTPTALSALLPTPTSLPQAGHRHQLLDHADDRLTEIEQQAYLQVNPRERLSSPLASESEASAAGHSSGTESATTSAMASEDAANTTIMAPFMLDEEVMPTAQTLVSPIRNGSTSSLMRHPLLSPPSSPEAERSSSATATLSAADAFSAYARAPRRWRARYHLDDVGATDDTVDSTSTRSRSPVQHAPPKRAFDQVSPSTGSTPPAESEPGCNQDPFSPITTETVTAARPAATSLRHSFDSQRATLSPRMRHLREADGSGLRRRSPASSRSGSRDRNATAAESPSLGDSPSRDLSALSRDRSKRLRAGSTSNSEMHGHQTMNHTNFGDLAATTTSLTTSFAPALGRYPSRSVPTDPVLVSSTHGRHSVASSSGSLSPRSFRPRLPLSFESLRRPISPETDHSTSAASPALAPTLATATTSSFSASPPGPQSSSLVMRPRPSTIQSTRDRALDSGLSRFLDDQEDQVRANLLLHARGRQILQDAEAALSEAREVTDRAERYLAEQFESNLAEGHLVNQDTPFDVQERDNMDSDTLMSDDSNTDATIERTARMLEQLPSPDSALPGTNESATMGIGVILPSTRHLPAPIELDERPVIGVRLGEGWTSRRRASTEMLQPTTEDASAVLSTGTSDEAPGSNGSRALTFLNTLRSRRPRLARNATGVPPPEESPEIMSPDREARGWLLDNDLATNSARSLSAAGASWQDTVRARQAEEASETSLWGQVHSVPETQESPISTEASALGRRLRGPTERANARWRLGQTPTAALPSTTTTTHATALAQGPPWRHITAAMTRAVTVSSEPEEPSASSYSATESPQSRSLFLRRSPRSHPSTSGVTSNSEQTESLPSHSHVNAPASITNRAVPSVGTSIAARRRMPWDSVLDEHSPASFLSSTTPASRRRSIFDSSSWESRRRSRDGTGAVGSNDEAERSRLEPTSHERTTSIATRQRITQTLPRTYAAIVARSGDGPGVRTRSAQAEADQVAARERVRATLADGDDDELASMFDRPTFVGPRHMLPSGSAGRHVVDPVLDRSSVDTTAQLAPGTREGGEHSESSRPRQFRWVPRRRSRTSTGQSGSEGSNADQDATRQEDDLAPSSPDSADSSGQGATLRRRRTIYDSPGATLPALEFDTTELSSTERATARIERLASMNRDRQGIFLFRPRPIARTTTAGTGQDNVRRAESEDVAAAEDSTRGRPGEGARPAGHARGPSSPSIQRRSLGELIRGLGGASGRWITAWDDDFVGFFTRDSAALDPRNYQADDEFDDSYDALIRLSERLGDVKPKGVSADKLSQLKTFKYAEWPMPVNPAASVDLQTGVATTSQVTMDVDQATSHLARKGVEKEERCAVCLQDYEEDEVIMLGLCSHGFHSDCLKAWLKEHGTCPVCRRDHAV